MMKVILSADHAGTTIRNEVKKGTGRNEYRI